MTEPRYTLNELAALLDLSYQGKGETLITGIAGLTEATAGQITFLDKPVYRKYLSQTNASAVIISAGDAALASSLPVLISKNPYLTYAKVARLFDKRPLPDVGIHPSAVIGKRCIIHSTARIGALCVIGDDCIIGQDSCLWPRVTLYDSTQLGERVMIHSGAVLGSDGFGNARDGACWVKVPQLGKVLVGNDVEIGANTTVDRGALEDTVIEEGVRLDNQIQVAHNVKIGAHTAIAACVAIAGSARIGKHCLIGGGASITGHISICDGVIITGMTGVSKTIATPGVYSSATIAQKNHNWRKMTVRLRHLDDLFNRVTVLEKQLAEQKEKGG